MGPDGDTAYVAIFHSGNRTTVLNEELVCNGGEDAVCFVDGMRMPGGLPGPLKSAAGADRPEVGLIVKFDEDTGHWLDDQGRDWSAAVRFDLPDYDVFAIAASASPPVEVTRFASVGTILFNMATNPVTGRVYVTNTDARNEVRFEGPGTTGIIDIAELEAGTRTPRVGMFGVAPISMFGGSGNTSHQGDQTRGFGYTHDGSVDTLFRFVSAGIFGLPEHERRDLEAFMLAFASNLDPVVGQQVTLSASSTAAATGRLDTLIARAAAGDCDLTAQGVRNSEDRGGLYLPAARTFTSDRATEAYIGRVALLAGAATEPLTFTCVPPKSGERIGVDRDGDGPRDRDELDADSDPADAGSPTFTCTGDCDRDGRVTIAELVRGVATALGNAEASTCLALDGDLDDQMSIADLIAAVNNALAVCQ